MDSNNKSPIVDNGIDPFNKKRGERLFDRDIEEHDPALYTATHVAKPLNGFDAIDDEQIDLFRKTGFLVVDNAFTPRETTDARDALNDLIMGRNAAFENVMFEGWSQAQIDTMTDEQRLAAVRKLYNFTDYDPRLKAIVEHPTLLTIIEKLVGDKPQLFQEMAMIKMPNGREKPWHQDRAYFDLDPSASIVGAWIALDEATIGNGCMHLMPDKGHEPIVHFLRRDWQICDTQMLGHTCTAVPLKPGGVLLFDSLLPHGTPINKTDKPRRAFQFHYAPVSAPKITREQRMAIFGSEGKDVYC